MVFMDSGELDAYEGQTDEAWGQEESPVAPHEAVG